MNILAPQDALMVEGLSVGYRVRGRDRQVLRDVSFRIGRGESYGLVGESGCGNRRRRRRSRDTCRATGAFWAGASCSTGARLWRCRGPNCAGCGRARYPWSTRIPAAALNPTIPIGRQVAEVFEVGGVAHGEAMDRARAHAGPRADLRSLARDAALSASIVGGMQQRVAIAMALAVERSLIILDEPTTAWTPRSKPRCWT